VCLAPAECPWAFTPLVKVARTASASVLSVKSVVPTAGFRIIPQPKWVKRFPFSFKLSQSVDVLVEFLRKTQKFHENEELKFVGRFRQLPCAGRAKSRNRT